MGDLRVGAGVMVCAIHMAARERVPRSILVNDILKAEEICNTESDTKPLTDLSASVREKRLPHGRTASILVQKTITAALLRQSEGQASA